MDTAHALPVKALTKYSLSDPRFIEETGMALIWKVRRSTGQAAALKVYKKGHMGNERTGFSFLNSLDGEASARVHEVDTDAAVIEWLDGPSLGDLVRKGGDETAAAHLVAVANKMHSVVQEDASSLPRLDGWFDALFRAEFATECDPRNRANILKCQEIAKQLLGEQQEVRPLHGDLHHDNIRLGQRGYCAFDAKGVLGERAYELANAFRNPKGVPDLVRDPERVRYLSALWSRAFSVERERLHQWVAVKAALSIVWRSAGALSQDAEFDLLDMFLSFTD